VIKKILLLAVALALYQGWQHFHTPVLAGVASEHNEVIMYSLTTCGYCKAKARDLKVAGIGFTEYYIDKDTRRRDELNQKLAQAGLPPRQYGTPILDVHGTMLPNNPSLAVIRKTMKER
jgi:glutaredoxin